MVYWELNLNVQTGIGSDFLPHTDPQPPGLNSLREAEKNYPFFSGPATKAFPPPPRV